MNIDRRLDAVEGATAPTTRLTGLCLELRRKKGGQPLLLAGGQFDRLLGRFTDAAVKPHVRLIEESQVEFIEFAAMWIASYRDGTSRDCSFALTAGSRRGGKSTATIFAQVAACIEVPNTIGWIVVDSFRSRDEVDRTITENFPAEWFHRRLSPNFSYTLANGSCIRILSADNADALKAGRCDVGNLIDLQKLSGAALLNVLGGTIDKQGIVFASANAPRKARGMFVLELKEKLEDHALPGSRFFGFDPAKNSTINQTARTTLTAIADVVDKQLGEADMADKWQHPGDLAYDSFVPRHHVREQPVDGTDITLDVTRRKFGRSAPYAGGLDPQRKPFNAMVIANIFRGLDEKPHYYVIDEILQDGTESRLLNAIENTDYLTPSNLVICSDGSAFWQDNERNPGHATVQYLQGAGFRVVPPQKKQSEKSKHAGNPNVEDRLNLVNTLFEQKRLFVSPKCRVLIDSLRKCEQKWGKPIGRGAHLTDALGYLMWLVEDRMKPRSHGGGVGGSGAESFREFARSRGDGRSPWDPFPR